jgi:hypothetical protein
MSQGVIFFHHGTKYAARLLVALYSLRRHYTGPVCVLDTGESGGLVEKIAAACGAEVKRIELVQMRRNSAYVTKSALWRHTPFDESLFLDCDTAALQPIDEIMQAIHREPSGMVLTRFAEWVSNGKMVGGRVSQWLDMQPLPGFDFHPGVLAHQCLNNAYPAVNTGVFGMRRDAEFLPAWEALTRAGWRRFIPDEISAQILSVQLPCVVLPDCWNFSPVYSRGIERAKVAHFHGKKNIERADGRGSQGHQIWWPIFCEAWQSNIAEVQTWAPAGDEHLALHVARLRSE